METAVEGGLRSWCEVGFRFPSSCGRTAESLRLDSSFRSSSQRLCQGRHICHSDAVHLAASESLPRGRTSEPSRWPHQMSAKHRDPANVRRVLHARRLRTVSRRAWEAKGRPSSACFLGHVDLRQRHENFVACETPWFYEPSHLRDYTKLYFFCRNLAMVTRQDWTLPSGDLSTALSPRLSTPFLSVF